MNSLRNGSMGESKKNFKKAFSTPLRAGKTYFFNWPKNRIFTSILRPKSMIPTIKLTRNPFSPTRHSTHKHLKPEADELKQSTYRSMHHETLKHKNSKTYQENDRGDGKRAFRDQGTLGLSLENTEETVSGDD